MSESVLEKKLESADIGLPSAVCLEIRAGQFRKWNRNQSELESVGIKFLESESESESESNFDTLESNFDSSLIPESS